MQALPGFESPTFRHYMSHACFASLNHSDGAANDRRAAVAAFGRVRSSSLTLRYFSYLYSSVINHSFRTNITSVGDCHLDTYLRVRHNLCVVCKYACEVVVWCGTLLNPLNGSVVRKQFVDDMLMVAVRIYGNL